MVAGLVYGPLVQRFAPEARGHGVPERGFTEDDWTDPDTPGLHGYPRSKAVAERAAWDFIAREGGDTELVVVPAAGHVALLERPEVVNAALVTLIESVRR